MGVFMLISIAIFVLLLVTVRLWLPVVVDLAAVTFQLAKVALPFLFFGGLLIYALA